MNKTQKGDITEQKFILYCLENDIPISKPIGNNLPYDFIIEYNQKLLKIQVKTSYHPARNKNKDIIEFKTISSSKNYNEIVSTDYIGKADYFVTLLFNRDYLPIFIPVCDAARSSMKIYTGEKPSHKHQHWYKDYLIANIV